MSSDFVGWVKATKQRVKNTLPYASMTHASAVCIPVYSIYPSLCILHGWPVGCRDMKHAAESRLLVPLEKGQSKYNSQLDCLLNKPKTLL